jgi:uncharacterized protein (UPF0335 family)
VDEPPARLDRALARADERDDARVTATGDREMDRPGGVAADQLRSVIERIERLEEEKKALGDDIKDVYAEAKANGFDTKVIRQVIRLRKKDSDERQEEEALLDLYMHALGMRREPAEPEAEHAEAA